MSESYRIITCKEFVDGHEVGTLLTLGKSIAAVLANSIGQRFLVEAKGIGHRTVPVFVHPDVLLIPTKSPEPSRWSDTNLPHYGRPRGYDGPVEAHIHPELWKSARHYNLIP